MARADAQIKDNLLFQNLSEAKLQPYLDRTIERSVWKGEIIENEGNYCESLAFVLKGCLSIEKYTSNGNYVTMDLLDPGDTFGEDLIFSDDPHYQFSIEAASDARLLILPRGLILEMAQDMPEFQKNFLNYLSLQSRRKNRRILVLSQRNLRQKISAYLIALLEEQGGFDLEELSKPQKYKNRTHSVELPVSKEVAANLLAMPRPSFSRELLRMEEDGLIRVDGRVIWLTNLVAIENGGLDEEDDL